MKTAKELIDEEIETIRDRMQDFEDACPERAECEKILGRLYDISETLEFLPTEGAKYWDEAKMVEFGKLCMTMFSPNQSVRTEKQQNELWNSEASQKLIKLPPPTLILDSNSEAVKRQEEWECYRWVIDAGWYQQGADFWTNHKLGETRRWSELLELFRESKNK